MGHSHKVVELRRVTERWIAAPAGRVCAGGTGLYGGAAKRRVAACLSRRTFFEGLI